MAGIEGLMRRIFDNVYKSPEDAERAALDLYNQLYEDECGNNRGSIPDEQITQHRVNAGIARQAAILLRRENRARQN